MRWRRPRILRAVIVGLTLVGQVVACCGLPVPARAESPLKDSATPFPCQDNPCGCATAEQCWTSCCCTTPEQRFAWAEAHGVTPPAYATKPGGWSQPRRRDREAGDCPHCVKAESAPVRSKAVRWAVGWCAQKCRGAGPSFLLTAPALPEHRPTAWAFDWVCRGALPLPADTPHPLAERPAIPPPRA